MVEPLLSYNYIILCCTHKRLVMLFRRMLDILENKKVRCRVLKDRYLIDIIGDYTTVRFITYAKASRNGALRGLRGKVIDDFDMEKYLDAEERKLKEK